MKLIRLTTRANKAEFRSDFNEDIIIKPNSSVCLQSCGLEVVLDEVNIDGTNDNIVYNVRGQGGNSPDRIITLNHTGSVNLPNYNVNNIKVLFQDITNKLNSKLVSMLKDYGSGTAIYTKELGCEWRASLNAEGFFELELRQAKMIEARHTTDYQTNAPLVLGEKAINIELTNPYMWRTYAGKTPTASLDAMSYLEHSVCKGAGIHQCQINKLPLGFTGDSKHTGFIIGFTKNPIGEYIRGRQLSVADISYGLEVRNAPTADPSYFRIVDGAEATNAQSSDFAGGVGLNSWDIGYYGVSDPRNDYVALHISEGHITGVIYYNNQASKIILDKAYDGETALYPFIAIRGAYDDIRVSKVSTLTDPYFDTNPRISEPIDDEKTISTAGVGNPFPPHATGTQGRTSKFLSFTGNLGDFLGYTQNMLPPIGYDVGDGFLKTATYKFNLVNHSDTFLATLDNLPITSYDDYDKDGRGKGGRSNILCVIPQSDDDGTIIYEPNTLNFIDLDNRDSFTLRNIKAKILTAEYEDLNVKGLSCMTLLIKDKSE